MKPTGIQSKLLHGYFKKILGYGNKCSCGKQGHIQNITEHLIEFYCKPCNKRWAFESKEKVESMLQKSFGL